MSQKNILAILGSPRTKGTTATMLNYAISEAEKVGYNVTKVNLYEKNIAYCKGCNVCDKTGVCVQKDDIQEIVTLLKESSIVILAAPVYWANVPAPVKNLFDRLKGTAMEETKTFPRPRLKGRKYIILTSCHTAFPFSWIFGQSRGAIRNIDEFFKTAGMKPISKIVYANPSAKSELPKSVIKKIKMCWK